MADILRTLKQIPSVYSNLTDISLVEASPYLRTIQEKQLVKFKEDGIEFHWFDRFNDVPSNDFVIYLAHEFFDALPIYQFQKTAQGWRELMVDLDTSNQTPLHFRHTLAPTPTKSLLLLAHQMQYESADLNEIVQISPDTWDITTLISQRIKEQDGIALFTDYGDISIRTNKLRGIQSHRWVSPFSMPGQVDLSSDVEFGTIKLAAEKQGSILPCLS
jgi:NADH dehydrogenase [ubiquinone] 1 alpha subcomplex assembly factor 7